MVWTTQSLSEALSINIDGDKKFGKLQFNSINVEPGDLFIALRGNRDGHEFVQEALDKRASAAIVSEKNADSILNFDKEKLILVEDTYQALTDLAIYKRKNSKAKFIAVTGSVGKTTTKEALKIMLSAHGKTHASYASFNNYLGVRLSLASISEDVDYVVMETGMNSKGELSNISRLIAPDIAIITTISEAHIGFFDSVKEIARAKCEIFEYLDSDGGVAIINRDMEMYEFCAESIHSMGIDHIKTFGQHVDSGTRVVSCKLLADNQLQLKYNINNNETEVIMNSIPPHFAENFAASFAVIDFLKLDSNPSAMAIRSFTPGVGRGELVSAQSKQKEYNIICDYYNSSPQSLKASLEYLSEFENKNKVAILGDMAELGKFQLDLHKSIVPYIKKSGIKKLFLVGSIIPRIKEEFGNDIQILCYLDTDMLINEIDRYLSGGELILIKGSRSMKLEIIAKYLGC
jgi:UDP-N-acetylmuramoyl-tripeptide--D-alanyl-D-alanine ligase